MVGHSALSAPFFHDEAAAYAKLESILWPHGPVCPRCGCLDRITDVRGKTARAGLRRCGHCKRQFTVKVGTVFESSHVPLNLWLQATHLLTSSKKGMSSHQIHRTLGVQYNTAWFMTMRLREAMRDGKLPPLGGLNKVVETDTTWVGGKEKNKHKSKRLNQGRGAVGKEAAFSLIERDGRVRSFHLPEVNAKTLRPILKAQINDRSYLMTDDGGEYRRLGSEFAGHGTVNHSTGEYVRSGGFHHTNTIENYFSILKRGITGTYHHVSQQHLKRYLAEFDFRHNERAALGVTDAERASKALEGIVGKRLTYRDS
jgi:transposase-like protein